MTTIERRRARADARALPRRGGLRRARRRARLLRGLRHGRADVLLLPTWSIIHSRHWKAQIPYLARHARVVTFDGRGNGRSDRPAEVEAYAEREFAADALAVMDATGTDRAVLVSLSAGALWGSCSPPSTPSGSRARRSSRRPRRSPSTRARDVRAVRRAAGVLRGLGQVQPPLLARELPRLPRVLLRPGLHRAALDQADRGLRGLGPGDRRRDAGADLPRRRAARRRDEFAELCAGSRARCSSSTAPRTRSGRSSSARSSREVTGGALVALEGRALPARARPGARQPAAARLRRAAAGTPGAGRAGRAAASARSTSRRRSGSATPGATSRSPASCAGCTPTSRSTGSPSTP